MHPVHVIVSGYRWCRRVPMLRLTANLTWLIVGFVVSCVWLEIKNAGKKHQQLKLRKKNSDLGVINPAEKLQVPIDSVKNQSKTRKQAMSMSNEWKTLPGDSANAANRSSGSLANSFGAAKGGIGGLRIRPKLLVGVVIMLVIVLIFLLLPSPKQASGNFITNSNGEGNVFAMTNVVYNKTYPMTAPERTLDGQRFRIGLISDLDTDSKFTGKDNTWVAYHLKGYLSINSLRDQVGIQLDKQPSVLKSQLSRGGRGMELSELVTFNGKLYSVDDRTGVVYEIIDNTNTVVPWIILSDGDGKNTKGFKGEWMAVRDQHLFVGGLGKEWTTTTGELVNLDPQWVKAIDHQGGVHHLNWVKNYNAMRSEAGYSYPGYMIHESGVWSDIHKRWFFMPRRASAERYTEADDEHRATNLLISCSADFSDVRVNKIGTLNNIRGFSSFKFVPGTRDTVVVALKTEEDRGKIATYYTAFNINGKTLVPETKFADVKYEGIEFI